MKQKTPLEKIMPHPDEVEEMNMFIESEDCAAFRQSKRERENDEQIPIALNDGKFVVILQSEDYCPRTDAFMGIKKTFCSSHDSREEAELALNQINQDDMEEAYHVVLPFLPVPIRSFDVVYSDIDLPF